jgi:hypothetical protein
MDSDELEEVAHLSGLVQLVPDELLVALDHHHTRPVWQTNH